MMKSVAVVGACCWADEAPNPANHKPSTPPAPKTTGESSHHSWKRRVHCQRAHSSIALSLLTPNRNSHEARSQAARPDTRTMGS